MKVTDALTGAGRRVVLRDMPPVFEDARSGERSASPSTRTSRHPATWRRSMDSIRTTAVGGTPFTIVFLCRFFFVEYFCVPLFRSP